MGVPVLRTKLRREILAHKGQFAAVSVIVMLGVAVFGAYYDAYLNLGSSYDHIYDRLGFADLTVSGGDTARFAEDARAVPGVAVVENRVVGDVPLRVGGDHELLGRVVGLAASAEPDGSRINQLQILDGDTVGPDERALLVDQHMADHFDLGPGDRLEVAGPEGFRHPAGQGRGRLRRVPVAGPQPPGLHAHPGQLRRRLRRGRGRSPPDRPGRHPRGTRPVPTTAPTPPPSNAP